LHLTANTEDNVRVDLSLPLLGVRGSTVRFGEVTSVGDLSVRMSRGVAQTFIGETGAGKLTSDQGDHG
jgi:ABC-type branched-subunit amino acid transport system ATPase component